MWVYLARCKRIILAERGMLACRTPTGMSTSSPSIIDRTSKPTEIVGNVEAKGNVNKTFVVTTHGTSNTSDPSPTIVSQVSMSNARPDFPTTKAVPL